jgi:hypothetical protein
MATRPLRGSTDANDLGDLDEVLQSAIAALSSDSVPAGSKVIAEPPRQLVGRAQR